MKRFKFLTFFLFFFVFSINYASSNEIDIHYFCSEDMCNDCIWQQATLEKLQKDYDFNVKKHHPFYEDDSQQLFNQFEKAYNGNFKATPITIIWKDYVIWDNKVKTKELIQKYSQTEDYPDPYEIVKEQKDKEIEYWRWSKKEIFGRSIEMENIGRVAFGMILWFVDGINPCVLGVLVFLLTYLISIWSKKRLLIAWTIFVATTFLFYFFAMLLIHHTLFNVTYIAPYINYIKIGIWVLWVILWMLSIKDFLWYKWWPSLAIPKKVKPTIIYIAQKWTYLSAFVLAFFASLVELPCTIWIPLMYISAVWEHTNIIWAILLYNWFYVIPVLIVILSIYFSFDKIKAWQKEVEITKEEKRKWMKLLSWIVLIIIWLLFILWII